LLRQLVSTLNLVLSLVNAPSNCINFIHPKI
jgi:hypothetical protein